MTFLSYSSTIYKSVSLFLSLIIFGLLMSLVNTCKYHYPCPDDMKSVYCLLRKKGQLFTDCVVEWSHLFSICCSCLSLVVIACQFYLRRKLLMRIDYCTSSFMIAIWISAAVIATWNLHYNQVDGLFLIS